MSECVVKHHCVYIHTKASTNPVTHLHRPPNVAVLLDLASSSDHEDLPVNLDAGLLERRLDALCDRLEVLGRQSEDGRSSAGETDAEETGMGDGRVRGEDGRETRDLGRSDNGQEAKVSSDGRTYRGKEAATDEDVSVRLVDAVLHGLVDEVRVGRGLAERGREHGQTLEVEDL